MPIERSNVKIQPRQQASAGMHCSACDAFSYSTILTNSITPHCLEDFSRDWGEDTILGFRCLKLINWPFRKLTKFIGRKFLGISKGGTVSAKFNVSRHMIVSTDLEVANVA